MQCDLGSELVQSSNGTYECSPSCPTTTGVNNKKYNDYENLNAPNPFNLPRQTWCKLPGSNWKTPNESCAPGTHSKGPFFCAPNTCPVGWETGVDGVNCIQNNTNAQNINNSLCLPGYTLNGNVCTKQS